jgi:hypothetical protein
MCTNSRRETHVLVSIMWKWLNSEMGSTICEVKENGYTGGIVIAAMMFVVAAL